MSNKLFQPTQVGQVTVKNRIVMAPMTRGRATNPELVPPPLMAEYYGQRASAGLIITEGTWVNKEGIGYINVPGIYSQAQIEGWKAVVKAVHDRGSKIFSQLAHIGAVSHPDLLEGNLPLGPSAVNPMEQCYTTSGFKDTPVPRAMTVEDIRRTVDDFRKAAINAKAAGFDGIEIHGGYLYFIPEFLSSTMNVRTDEYGGSAENRSRIVFDILDAVIGVWGPGRVGIKLSPAASSGTLKPNADTEPTYTYLARKLNDYPLAYVQAWGNMGPVKGTAAEPFEEIGEYFRKHYKGTLIVGGGYTKESAEAALEDGDGDLVAFGAPFIANPDLVERFQKGAIVASADKESFYTGGAHGYTHYPVMTAADHQAA
jgi:N-ethylmaleimide reductase